MDLPQSTGGERLEISGFVLAGGRSTRLGRDKVLLPWNGETLLGHAVRRMQRVCGAVSVCADRADLRERLPESIAIVRDAIPGAGPLGGIVAALEASQTDWNLFLAVDLPLVPVEFLQALASYTQADSIFACGPRCILPRVEGLAQPLCGVYHRSLTAGMRRALAEGKYKIVRALEFAISETEHTISETEGRRSSPTISNEGRAHGTSLEYLDVDGFHLPDGSDELCPRDWFVNINTAPELQRARDLVFARGPRIA